MNEDEPTIPSNPSPPSGPNPADTADTGQSPRPALRPAHKEPDHIGSYRILEKLGEGGMGIVYKAEQREPVRRLVALKVIKLGMDSKEVVARFEAERQALAMLSHPNVAKVFEAGMTEAGRLYFAMEHVAGVPLTQYCDENKFTTTQRLELFVPICQAVQHAHQKGIIHRDLKPSNILITLVDGKPVPKVIDFGIAKATNQALTSHTLFTETGALIGTPEYMSPEQAMTSGLDVDTRTDIYSLGVILYELLTGALPLDPKSLRAAGVEGMARLIKTAEPHKPSTRLSMLAGTVETTSSSAKRDTRLLQRELRGDLDWIVLKAMEKDRSRRYETANGLAADLNRHLNHEPVTARPPSTTYRMQKAFRRNRMAFTAAAMVVMALVVGFGVSTWQMVKARAAQNDAENARQGEQQQRVEAEAAQKVAETQQQRADVQAQKATESQKQARRLLYAADMNLAQQSLKLNNLGRARRLLDRHRPQPGEEDLRGWEWRYLWQLTRSSDLVTLTRRPVRGFDVSFSVDGTRLAVGWFDGGVELWDVPGRQLIRALTEGANSGAAHVAFSPAANLLAATSRPRSVTLYDLDSGAESILWRAPDQRNWAVRDLSFSQDGSSLVIFIASPDGTGDVLIMNVASATVESRHSAPFRAAVHFGAARLSPDKRRLYVACGDQPSRRYSIQCVDLPAGQEVWQTEVLRDSGLTSLAISPNGSVLVSSSGYEDPTIRVWEAATGRLLRQLEGHSAWICKLAFSRDGRQLISAATDQTIRFWDTGNWTETRVLRGHADEIHGVAASESAQLIASASKDGDVMLWREEQGNATDGYSRLSEALTRDQVIPMDRSRVLLQPLDTAPQVIDFKLDSRAGSLPGIDSPARVLGCFGNDTLCLWDGASQIVVQELRDGEMVRLGAIPLEPGPGPAAFAYNKTRRFLAWNETRSPNSVYLASLTAPGRRIELKSDARMIAFQFSEDGNHLSARTENGDLLRVWNVDTGQIMASITERVRDATFGAGGRVLVVIHLKGVDHDIAFYDLARPGAPPQRVPGRNVSGQLAVSPDGKLVASCTEGAVIRLFDPLKGELIDSLHGHMNAVHGITFSADGQRLVSTHGGGDAVKLWDVATRQELLNLSGTGSLLNAPRWSADGDVILAGAPWQAWRAPSWEEIAAVEAKQEGESRQP